MTRIAPESRRLPILARQLRWAVFAWLMLVAGSLAQAQAEPPVREWDRASAVALLDYIATLESHGLDPSDYGPAALRAALDTGDADSLDRRASDSFGRVARDLATGHLRPGERGRYYIASDDFDARTAADLIDRALAQHDVAGTLESLAPRTRQYAALRAALRALPSGASEQRSALRINLERWRWLPHELGPRYVMINIPEYLLRLVEDGRITAVHQVIVGKPNTPTPEFRTEAKGVILNPTWSVPQSIIAESVGSLVRNRPSVARARGYTWSWDSGHLRVVQQPGPQNALGQLKLDMPNPFTIYIHDTPSKQLFDREDRTFSHGCIRTQNPFDLAAELLRGTEWTPEHIADTVSSARTVRVPLEQPVPVYVVYFTAVAGDDGTIAYLGDPYRRNGGIAKALALRPNGAPLLAGLDEPAGCRAG